MATGHVSGPRPAASDPGEGEGRNLQRTCHRPARWQATYAATVFRLPGSISGSTTCSSPGGARHFARQGAPGGACRTRLLKQTPGPAAQRGITSRPNSFWSQLSTATKLRTGQARSSRARQGMVEGLRCRQLTNLRQIGNILAGADPILRTTSAAATPGDRRLGWGLLRQGTSLVGFPRSLWPSSAA